MELQFVDVLVPEDVSAAMVAIDQVYILGDYLDYIGGERMVVQTCTPHDCENVPQEDWEIEI